MKVYDVEYRAVVRVVEQDMVSCRSDEQRLQGLRKIHDLQKQFDQIARDTTTHFQLLKFFP